MEKRLKRARRVLDVMSQLHGIEQQKKLALQRRHEELEQSQRDIIHSLNRDDALYGLFIDTSARFLKSQAQEAKRVSEATDAQSRRVLDRARTMKTAERLTIALDERVTRSRKERELHDIIERYSTRRGASLP